MKSSRTRIRLWKFVLPAAAAGLFIVYLKVGILPGRLNEVAVGRLEAVFGQKVVFERIVYLPLRGISIDGLKTASGDGSVAFTSKKLLLKVPLPAFLLDNRIVVSKAVLDRPVLSLIVPDKKSGDDVWTRFLRGGVDAVLPENVYLERLTVKDGKAFIRGGPAGAPTPIETFDRLDLAVDFRKGLRIPIKGAVRLGQSPYAEAAFAGVWDLGGKAHEIHLKGRSNRVPEWAKDKFKWPGAEIRGIASDFDLDLVPAAAGRYEFRLATKNTRLAARWKDFTAGGSGAVTARGAWEPASGRVSLDRAALRIRDASLKGLPVPVGGIERIRGAVVLGDGRVGTTNLICSWHGVPTIVSGSFGTGAEGALRLEITQKSDDFAFLSRFVPEAARKSFDPSAVTGRIEIRGVLEGKTGDLANLRRSARISLGGVSWKPAGSDAALTGLRGILDLKNDRLDFSNLAFSWGGEKFTASGLLDLRPGAASRLALRHAFFRTDARFSITKNAALVEALEVAAGKTTARLTGTLGLSGAMRFEGEGKIRTDIREALSRLPGAAALLALKPAGVLTVTAELTGSLLDSKLLRAKLTCESPLVVFDGKIKLEEPILDAEVSHGSFAVPYGKAGLYGGELRFSGSAETSVSSPKKFRLSLSGNGLDLSRAVGDFDFLDKEFRGTLNLELALEGRLGNKSSVSGSGRFDVRYGRLFTTPLFKRLKNLVFVRIEGIDNLTFHRAEGNFSVADGWITTGDAVLSSPLINIQMSGKIGLDKTLRLLVRSRFTSDVMRQSDELGGLAPYIVNRAESQITEYSVTGTLLKPVYTEL